MTGARILAVDCFDVRFPTSREHHGSDAMNPDPDYSAAYVVLRTDPGAPDGHAICFTIGRGNDVVVTAIEALRPHLVGRSVADIVTNLGGFSASLTSDSQLRWLGPDKGVMHMAIGAVVNAAWDLAAKLAGQPLWRLLADMTPEELVALVDFRYIDDALTPAEALDIFRSAQPHRRRLVSPPRYGQNRYATTSSPTGRSGRTSPVVSRTVNRRPDGAVYSLAAAHRPVKAGAMGFFDDLPAAEPAPPPRRHHPWEPPEADFPGIVPIDTLVIGRTEQVAVAVTGLSAFSTGVEIFLTARIRPSDGRSDEHLPGGPRDLAAARRSFRFGLQFSDGGKAAGRPGDRGRDRDSEPTGPILFPFAAGGGPHSFVSRWWTWPLPPAGPLEFVCAWPAFGIAESRAGIDAQLILDAAERSVRLWPENEG